EAAQPRPAGIGRGRVCVPVRDPPLPGGAHHGPCEGRAPAPPSHVAPRDGGQRPRSLHGTPPPLPAARRSYSSGVRALVARALPRFSPLPSGGNDQGVHAGGPLTGVVNDDRVQIDLRDAPPGTRD